MIENEKLKEIITEIDFTVTSFEQGNTLNMTSREVIRKVSSIIFQNYLPLIDEDRARRDSKK